jgi:hypothetical protein
MNNLDCRAGNFVNIEVHFNNFMTDIFDMWKDDDWNDELKRKNAIDYEFKEQSRAIKFHNLLNTEYCDILNKNMWSEKTDVLCDYFQERVQDFNDWIDWGYIIIEYDEIEEEDEEEETK